jgi:mono/diheme cytochrome c family protein
MRLLGSVFFSILILAGAWRAGMTRASAQTATTPPTPAAPAPAAPAAVPVAPPKPLLDSLQWDSILKEQTPEAGQRTADFAFNVTNSLDTPVQIERVQTSCGCTVAKLPSTPWVLAPHTNGMVSVTVNLAGKSGTFFKTITVFSTNAQKVLTIKVTLPENPQMVRARNQQMAMADAQLVFRGACADCHVKPAEGLMGKALYVKSCGICHDAKPRATMVADLAHLNHPTDYAFWKMAIAEGKPKTLMPAFSAHRGGPLTDEQIDSLAKVLTAEYPSNPVQPIKTSSIQPTSGDTASAQPVKN